MQEQVDLALKNRKPEDVTELLLDNYKSATKNVVSLKGHNFSKLNHLSMIACDLESLEGLPSLPAVRVVDLSENALTDVSQLAKCAKNLYHLNLCGNKIDVRYTITYSLFIISILQNADALQPLSEIENLQAVDIYDCPLTEKEGYRENVFKVLPSLKFLDGFDINNEEADDLGMSSGGEDEVSRISYVARIQIDSRSGW